MVFEERIDNLIEAGWQVLNSDFDEVAFQRWRKEAFKFLNAVLGPEHTYTQYFEKYVRQFERSEVLTGGGILIAAKAEVSKGLPTVDQAPSPTGNLQGHPIHSPKTSSPALMLMRH